jgi:hypothetical protein
MQRSIRQVISKSMQPRRRSLGAAAGGRREPRAGGGRPLAASWQDHRRGDSLTIGDLAGWAAFGHIATMLHIAKLAVGIRDLPHLHRVQQARLADAPPLRHLTRNFPRRAPEVTAGGSLYWVVAGSMLVRQRILDIAEDSRDDGTRCAALVLDPELVPLVGRSTKPFQGWRYLAAADAPADLARSSAARGAEALPDTLRRELQALGLL